MGVVSSAVVKQYVQPLYCTALALLMLCEDMLQILLDHMQAPKCIS